MERGADMFIPVLAWRTMLISKSPIAQNVPARDRALDLRTWRGHRQRTGNPLADRAYGAVLRPARHRPDRGGLGAALIASSAQGDVSRTLPVRGHRNGHHVGDAAVRPQDNRCDHRAAPVRVRSPDHAYESTGSRACSARGWYR